MSRRLMQLGLLLTGIIIPAAGFSQPVPSPFPVPAPVAGAPFPESANAKTYATLPSAAATENICEQADGSIFVTLIDDKKLLKVATDGKVSEFASVPTAANMLGVGCGESEVALVVFNKTFRGAPNPSGQGNLPANFSDNDAHVMIYDLSGKLKADIPTEKGMGFNGFAYGGQGMYYAGDSGSGTIYRVDGATKKIEVWFRDAKYGPNAGNAIGINGVRVKNNWVYFAGASQNGIYKIQMGPDGKAQGAPQIVEQGIRADDFDVGNDGSVYFPAGTILFRALPTGQVTVMADPIQGGPSAVVTRDGKWVAWPTRGGTAPQRVVRVPIP